MNDEEYETQKARIRTLIARWPAPIGLKWWRMNYVYDRAEKDGNSDCAADCKADWRYMEATLTFYLPVVAEFADDRIEWCFVHELMHVFLKEQRWNDSDAEHSLDHEERVASTLTNAFLWVRDAVDEGQAPSLKAAVG